jgi:hypothetical protein
MIMAEKRKNRGRGRPPGKAPTEALQARIPPDLAQAFRELCERNTRKVTQELIIAIKEHLKRNPPPAAE